MISGTKHLIIQTASLIAGFMVWVLISSLMPYIHTDIALSSTQQAWATAVPVILVRFFEYRSDTGQINTVHEHYFR